MNASGLYILDGLDMWTSFGFAPVIGSNDPFLEFPERKDPPSHDWQDEDGIEYDLSTPIFKDRDITIHGTIIASNTVDFWAKHAALWNKLKEPGTLPLMINDLDKTFDVFYRKSTFKKITSIKGGRVATEISLTFTVTYS